MYAPEINHTDSECRTISASPRKSKNVQQFSIVDNRPSPIACFQVVQLDGDEEEKAALGVTINAEMKAIERLKHLTFGESMWATLDYMITKATRLMTDQTCSVQKYRALQSEIQEFRERFQKGIFSVIKSKIETLRSQYYLMSPYMQNAENEQIIAKMFEYQIFDPDKVNNLQENDLRKLEAYPICFQKLIENSYIIAERISDDWQAIAGVFHLAPADKLKTIILTGSDLHNDGQMVCIICTDQGQRVIYKPRSIMAEITILGDQQDSFLSEFNQDQTSPLKTLAFLPGRKQAGENISSYGYVECASACRKLTPAEEENYLIQMGKITLISKLLGILDLHQDNILTAAGGNAVMIDAEISFWTPYMLNLHNWTQGCLQLCLTRFTDEHLKLTENFYVTDADIAYLHQKKSMKAWERPEDYSFELGMKHKEDLCKDDNPRRIAFLRGIKLGAAALKQMGRDRFTKWVDEHLKSIGRVRIVPCCTQHFQTLRDLYWSGGNSYQSQLLLCSQEIFDDFSRQACGVKMSKEKLENLILQDVRKRDIPIFYFDVERNVVVYHDLVVAVLPFHLKQAMLDIFSYLTYEDSDFLQQVIVQEFLAHL